MYASFFRLAREPFSIAPDPRFLFMSEAHREALAHLLYGLSGGGGFVLLTGEIGAGKTTVCRCFLDQVPKNCNVAYIFNPKMGATELLRTICDEFHIQVPAASHTIKDYVDPLNAFLLRSHASGRNSVLIIDEAQSLSAEVLEQLRLLTNLETAERKLLQIVLIGQPELRTMLARPDLEQLAQRVIARYHLPALTQKETAQYVRHRLVVAGLEGELPFDKRALARLHQLCGGVPRRINLLADRALLGGYGSGKTRVGKAIVEQAAREVFGRKRGDEISHNALIALGVGGLAVAAIGVALAWPRAARAPAPGAAAAPASSAAASAVPLATAADAPASAPSKAAATTAAEAAAASAAASPSAVLAASLSSEAAAWRELAAAWKLDLPATTTDPCEAALRERMACFRGTGGLAQLRDLGRPAVLTLRDGRDRPTWMLLSALGDQSATLEAAGVRHTVSLWALAAIWRGEFATFWRMPKGYRDGADGSVIPLATWLSERLPGTPEQPLRARVTAFQVAHGLKPDGMAGPMTMMHVNRASGVDEPKLSSR